MTRRLVNGLALVVIGAILLMNTTGYLPWRVWDAAIGYWPVLLIGLGLQIVWGDRHIPWLAVSVVVILIMGAMNPYGGWRGFLKSDGPGFEIRLPRGPWRPMDHTKNWTVPLKPSVSKSDIEMSAPSVELDLKGDPSLNEKSGPEALSASLAWDKYEPTTSFSDTEKEVRIRIEAPDTTGSGAGKQEWEVGLNTSLATSIDISAGVAKAKLDCASVYVSDVTVEAGVTELDLILGLTGKETRVTVAGGVASVEVSLPRAVGLRVRVTSPLTFTHDLGSQGLTRSGNEWVTPDYSSASTKVDITVTCGTGNIKANRID